jgi:hypothetical protein
VRLLGLLETLGAEDPLGALAYCCPPFLTQARSKLQHEVRHNLSHKLLIYSIDYLG